jgi:hypothetical protein
MPRQKRLVHDAHDPLDWDGKPLLVLPPVRVFFDFNQRMDLLRGQPGPQSRFRRPDRLESQPAGW